MALSEKQIVSIVNSEIENSQGLDGDDISLERAKALDYYNGSMDQYMPVAKDRSNVVSRDVLDTVESILPSLIKIFTDTENAIEFTAVGAEDEAAAEQETDVVKHIVWEQNQGFLNLYTFLKDCLLSKNGILKSIHEEGEWLREEYKGLDEYDIQKILNDPAIEIEVIEEDSGYNEETGGIDLVLKTKPVNGKITILPVPCEEFGISKGATSPDPKQATFSFHRAKKTVGELIAAGYDRDLIESIPTDDANSSLERNARYSKNDEDSEGTENITTREIWVTEAYVYLDTNDDGIGELQKVTLASGSTSTSENKFLDMEEVDSNPFVSATPIIRTHAYSGFSVADLVMDIQEIRTTLTRSIVDNTIASNNTRIAVNDMVNLDDLLTSRPNGVVQTEGESPPGNHIFPIQHTPVPQQAFGLLEMLEDTIKQRTGIGDEVAGLDTSALSNINTGVIVAALEQSRMRIELIARIIAEVGLKPLFKDIHALAQKNNTKALALKLNNEWVQVNPSNWRNRTDLTVNVGIGRDSKEKKIAMLDMTYQQQTAALQSGMPYVTPINLYQTVVKKAKLIGIDPQSAWTDPVPVMEQAKQQPPAPDSNMIQAQIQDSYNKATLQQNNMKHIDNTRLKREEMDQRERFNAANNDVAIAKSEAEIVKKQIDEQNQIMTAKAEQARALVSAEIARSEQARKASESTWKQQLEQQKVELDKYKSDLAALTKIVSDQNTALLKNELQNDVLNSDI